MLKSTSLLRVQPSAVSEMKPLVRIEDVLAGRAYRTHHGRDVDCHRKIDVLGEQPALYHVVNYKYQAHFPDIEPRLL